MFGRSTPDSVTELKQRCDSVRLLFLITFGRLAMCRFRTINFHFATVLRHIANRLL